MSTTLPQTYPDAEYESAHTSTYERPPRFPIKAVFPPGVRESDFHVAISEFIAALGEANVFIGEALSDYIDPYDVHEHDTHEEKRKIPSAAVCPDSTEQLREVLRIANKFAIPVWTFSRGKNLGYGGPAPRVNGSVALDLHRMNRIVEVNDEFHYAVVEPGVTFIDLYNYCVENGKKVWPSTASLGWGSVMGNVSFSLSLSLYSLFFSFLFFTCFFSSLREKLANSNRPSIAAWVSAPPTATTKTWPGSK